MTTGNTAKTFLLFVNILIGVVNSGRHYDEDNLEQEFVNHRLNLLEQGMSTYVYDSIAKMTYMQNQVEYLSVESSILQAILNEQKAEIDTLKWATENVKETQLTQEERDLVTELKWTIFDLKHTNEELQEDACFRNTDCYEWSGWSMCSVECGSGSKIRSRDCVTSGKFSSMCKPLDVQEEECKGNNCIVKHALSQFDCPDEYYSFQGFCFRFSGRQDSRLLSTIICDEEGSHLVLIDNDDKQKAVFDFLNIVAPEYMVDMHEDFSKREYWNFKDIDQKTNVAVDGVRKEQRTVFLNWRDDVMTYFNWAVGEPRNDKSDGDYCATLNVLTGEWYMKCCSVTFYYVCESNSRTGL